MKEKITITVSTEILDWIDKKIGEREFGSRSHAFELGVYKMIQRS